MPVSTGFGLVSDRGRTALLVRCGLNRRPVVSRPLARRGAAGPASLREDKPAVCSGRNLLARKPALLVQPSRTCEAARPLPVLVVRIEGQTGTGPEPLRQLRKGTDMAKSATHNRSYARQSQLRKGATLEMVRLTCPDATQALKIAESFGAAIVDSDGIRSLHERLIVETADSLSEGLGEKAMQIHLQRIVGIQSHALRMAAEGAVAAYEQVVGESWKPFDRPIENPGASLDRKAAEAQMAAFG